MRRFFVSCVALGVAGLLAAPVHAQGRPGGDFGQAGRNGWLADYSEAKAVAKKAGKPLMVVFRCVP